MFCFGERLATRGRELAFEPYLCGLRVRPNRCVEHTWSFILEAFCWLRGRLKWRRLCQGWLSPSKLFLSCALLLLVFFFFFSFIFSLIPSYTLFISFNFFFFFFFSVLWVCSVWENHPHNDARKKLKKQIKQNVGAVLAIVAIIYFYIYIYVLCLLIPFGSPFMWHAGMWGILVCFSFCFPCFMTCECSLAGIFCLFFFFLLGGDAWQRIMPVVSAVLRCIPFNRCDLFRRERWTWITALFAWSKFRNHMSRKKKKNGLIGNARTSL